MATLQMYMDQSRIENMFESGVYEEVWGKGFGVDNSVGKIGKSLCIVRVRNCCSFRMGNMRKKRGPEF